MKKLATCLITAAVLSSMSYVQAADTFVSFGAKEGGIMLMPNQQGTQLTILYDPADYPGITRALNSLQKDMTAVTGKQLQLQKVQTLSASSQGARIIVGSYDKSALIQRLVSKKAIDKKALKGCREKYIITMVDGDLVIAGADKRGTEYGIYELSRQLGVSPWSWWADMPVEHHDTICLTPGVYTDGEPVVQYRGIFLNDEAPCLSGWVKEKFPDSACENLPVDSRGNTYARGFNHNFYEHVFELLLRLKGNYLWPAMWGNAFYFDDPLNGPLADEMGIIMGTSHHEPMARNHQEWVRYKNRVMSKAGARRDEDAPAEARWDYDVNQEVIDKFFREGIERAKGTEDLITIGMRGDGDTGLGGKEGHDELTVSRDEYNKKLMERILSNQRDIIAKVTGKKADQTPQMWALYKEVQHLYDIGLNVPEDVLIMLCDDNWGDIRKVPGASAEGSLETLDPKLVNRKGGWGMYYHVDYVGGPRNTKWANVTTTDHLWEQMRLSYEYGIDRLWILNVGDLKPMEYPIDLFLKMAWNPDAYKDVATVHQHTLDFCEQLLGQCTSTMQQGNVVEATRLLETYLRYNSRVTPELLDWRTYNLKSGEWEQVKNQYKALEADAMRLWLKLSKESAPEKTGFNAYGQNALNAYQQLILYPIQSMANLYEMYYAQAMNLYLANFDDPRANEYADLVEACFARDEELTREYHDINGGKWNHLMDQAHIGYVTWQQPDKQVCPKTKRVTAEVAANALKSGYIFANYGNVVSIEGEHVYEYQNSQDGQWTVLPTLSRTLSGVALLPHNAHSDEASLTYAFRMNAVGDKAVKDGTPKTRIKPSQKVKVHIVTNSTLPFLRQAGHRYLLQLDGAEPVEVNYNSRFVEENTNAMYAVAATRVIETVTELVLGTEDLHKLTITPVDPGLVVEKVVIDLGGYDRSHLFGNESPMSK